MSLVGISLESGHTDTDTYTCYGQDQFLKTRNIPAAGPHVTSLKVYFSCQQIFLCYHILSYGCTYWYGTIKVLSIYEKEACFSKFCDGVVQRCVLSSQQLLTDKDKCETWPVK